MKKLLSIIFLGIMVVAVVTYAARLDTHYQDLSNAATNPLTKSLLSEKPSDSKNINRMQPLTFAFLFGTGLAGLVLIRRK
jgi:hypothetical protein